MKKLLSIGLPFAFGLFFLTGCGPGPKPNYLEGAKDAPATVSAFLTALQQGDYDLAKSLTHEDPDYIVADLDRCKEIFFERQPTGRRVLDTGYEIYHREWEIFVDLQINYGQQVKQIHFILAPGPAPKIRSVAPIIPE